MRPIWTGSLSFGLVNIPIKLYSAIEHKGLGFKMLHRKDNSLIRFKRFCEKEDKEVEYADIVKGFEVDKGEFYVMGADELKKLKPEKADTIEITEFVDSGHIDPIFIDSHYFLAPQKEKEKAFFLFREVLNLTNKVAIGRFVMRDKEYVCLVQAYKKGMLLNTLNYAYEIRDIDYIEELKSGAQLKEEEIELAKQLIDRLYKTEFDIMKFKDTFFEKLKAAIKKKEKVGFVEVGTKKQTKKQDLMEALKASLK